MFPSFTSLSQRERKRQELLRQAEKELAIERQLDQRYAETMWSADNENTINITKSTTTTTTQTNSPVRERVGDPSQDPATVPTATVATESVTDTVPGLFSEDDRLRVDAALNDAPAVPAPLSPITTTTDQNIAYNDLKKLFADYPDIQTWLINPIFNTESQKRSKTYSFGKDMDLYQTRDRKFVGNDKQRELLAEIDWVATLGHVKKKMQAKGLLSKNIDTDVDMSGLIRVPNVMAEPTRPGRERSSSWNKLAQTVSDKTKMNKLKSDIPGWGPNKRALEDSAVSGDERVSKQRNLLELSRSQPEKVKMMETNGDVKAHIRDIYQLNPWLIRYPLSVITGTRDNDGELQDVELDLNGNVIWKKNKKLVNPNQLAKANINWMLTFENIIYYLYTVLDYYKKNPDKIEKDYFKSNLKEVKSTLKNYGFRVDYDSPMQIEDLEMKTAVGRGLRGAGYVSRIPSVDKDGNPIVYHSKRGYNLTQLEGLGTASAMTYKRIGTKFVHLPKLNDGLLKVVYPSRSQVGNQKKIGVDLANLIKTLVFDGTINQQLYESLPVNDKRLFHELLRITHTQNSLKDPVKDPRDVLKQEYIKLKGELMLGNDNPTMIRELKKVLVDMYSTKLISDEEFKEVLLALV